MGIPNYFKILWGSVSRHGVLGSLTVACLADRALLLRYFMSVPQFGNTLGQHVFPPCFALPPPYWSFHFPMIPPLLSTLPRQPFLRRLGQGVQLVLMVGLISFSVFAVQAKPAIATGVYNMPPVDPAIHVYAEAKLFSRLTTGKLEKKLEAIATTSDTNVSYVTFRRLDYGETIDSFTQELFRTWFPTEEEQANQILIALDAVTSTSAIKVGTAVPSTLTETIANSLAQESLLIPIRDGNYNEAFLKTSDRLASVLAGEPDPGAPEIQSKVSVESTFTSAEDTDQGSATIIVVVLLVLATAIPMITYFAYQR